MADRVLPVVLLALAVAMAGCGVDTGSSPTDATRPTTASPTVVQPTTATETRRTVVPRREYPTPPEHLANGTAERVALDYETTLVHNVLRNLSVRNFTVDRGTEVRARVLNHSDDGIYVRTSVEFFYTMGIESYGCTQRATYFVNGTTIERVGGTDVTPLCSG